MKKEISDITIYIKNVAKTKDCFLKKFKMFLYILSINKEIFKIVSTYLNEF